MIFAPKTRRAASAVAPSSSKFLGKIQPSMTRVHRTPNWELRVPIGRRSVS
jgi:hypothetical protein